MQIVQRRVRERWLSDEEDGVEPTVERLPVDAINVGYDLGNLEAILAGTEMLDRTITRGYSSRL